MDGKEFVWEHFKFNAEQRLRGFNFFVLLSIFANGGVFAAVEKGLNPWLLFFLGIFICVLAIAFWLIDERSRDLINITIPALKEIESELPESYRLFAIDAFKDRKFTSYKVAIRMLFVMQLVCGIGVICYSSYLWFST